MPHLLIVEDEWVIYDDMAQFFKSKGYSVAAYAPSFEAAMANVREQTPDIALLDIQLEGHLNGIQLGTILKETHQIPIIFISNFEDLATRNLALKTNPNGYFFKSKNTDNEELLTNVQLALQLAKQQKKKEIEYILAIQESVYANKKETLKNQQETKVRIMDVIYIHTNKDDNKFLDLLTVDETFKKRKTIKDLCNTQKLPFNFIKISRTHIVNLFMVSEKNASELTLLNEQVVKISRQNRKRVKERFEALFL